VIARRLHARLACVAFAIVVALTSALPVSVRAVSPPDPDAIFNAARKAWSFTAYPRYATYTIVTKFRNGDVNVERHYDAIEDMRRDLVFAHTFSREEIANPAIPHGFNVRVGSLNGQGGAKVGAGDGNPDRIGPLAISCNYDFGISLLPQKTTVVSSGKDIQFPPSLPVIGTTRTATRDYTVRLIGMLDNGKTYHLGLEPTHDAGRLRLREMWVSAGTFLTRRILVSANFDAEPYTSVPWLVEFTHIGGADYIAKETALAPLEFDDNVSLPNVTIAFEELKLLSALPQYGAFGANDSSKAVAEP
jgi:hypothetical protein